ncbi:nuclear transport factor 2 family protein [Alisedimentitalea sp. MJ-SS2]|uniref:nuclear transport factor 2 family protein n=1 Tax=Aliisedimentitalea sp. MJ-SS2 TaxID=3049795 RepID=UPI00291553AB|nr:nuclear transport factor 2 family protein [Alisedimentitalea sp. MJ-SS2]MDU8926680.1 nuclear transport factor 2 family protein [Alisedimentitalea sp. MJ-SS2]
MPIHAFMDAYKRVWEAQDSEGFADLFTPDGQYWNTPFQCQDTWELRKVYWDRIKLQDNITHSNEVLAETPNGGFAHWHTEYQVSSEELFDIWAKSTGTGLPDRKPGDPLPYLILDGTLVGQFNPEGLATEVRIWWHSRAEMP